MIKGLLQRGLLSNVASRYFSTTPALSAMREYKDDHDKREAIKWSKDLSENVEKGSKQDFYAYIDAFITGNPQRKGMLEFIYACVTQVKPLGFHQDIEVYKKIMKIFPEGKYIPENKFQEMFFHMPRHVECAIAILSSLEEHGVQPDREMRKLIISRFGTHSRVFKKYARQIYWTQKFLRASPFPLPKPLPNSALQLAVLGIERICPDLRNQITIYKEEKDLGMDNTWIVSGQSPDQQELLRTLPTDKPIFVEGPHLLWLREQPLSYFSLRAEPKPLPPPPLEEYEDDLSDLKLIWFGEQPSPKDPMLPPTLHEQDDGVILALCATGTSSRESLLTWIRVLQKSNPHLSKMAVAFNLKSPPMELAVPNFDPEAWTFE